MQVMSENIGSDASQTGKPLKLEPLDKLQTLTAQHVVTTARSAPGTPNATTGDMSNSSPAHIQRRASSTSQSRPGSSASPRLNRKPSRTSLGGSSPRREDDASKYPTPKRSISNLITELRGAHATMESIPEPVILTAPQIAEAYLSYTLLSDEKPRSRTLVLLHDACYGHRYSRLKTSKGTLSMIVERPERILASVLGIASTYVRMGGYHAGAHNAPHPKHTASGLPPFQIKRSKRALELRSTYVTNVHGTEWMTELNTLCDVAEKRLAAGEKEVARVASSSGKEKRSLHEGDLYLCKESLDAFQGALGGVADAVDAVFDQSIDTSRAFVAVRPPGHHCSADHPSGFCWINNVHVGIEYAAQTYGLTHAAIIDFDLHHGDGSQSIAWERNSSNNYKRLYAKANSKLKLAPDVGYYSLHDINSYPCEMGDDEKVQAASLCIHNAHGQSIWNVHLQPWTTIEEFWKLYETRYMILLEKATEFLKYHTARLTVEGKQRPKSAIFISAGFDASEWEGEGMQRHKVSVPTDFYARFTADIARVAETQGTACDGRVISVLEGGYSDRALCSSTISHLSALATHSSQEKEIRPANTVPGGLGSSMLAQNHATDELGRRMQSISLNNGISGGYDPKWWSADNLTALEHHVNPPAPVAAGGKKVRVGPQPTYATPTESFAYKVIDPAKFARSVSGTMREGNMPVRPATPPPPEVDWIVATHELSKLLTPTDRTTRSCTAEELAGVKVKKERSSDIGLTPSPDELGKPRQLRTRGKAPAVAKRVASNSDRRKTMADLPSIAADLEPPTPAHRKPSRRSSMASTVSTTLQDADAPPVPAVPAAVRPAPVRVPSDGMQVKKTRAPVVPAASKAKKPAAGTRSPAKKTVSVIDEPPSAVPVRQASPSQTDMSSPVDSEVASVDALASGMKRITLKVGSREDSDKKAKEKLDADRRARALKAAETRRNNKAAKELKAAAEKKVQSSITSAGPSTNPGGIESGIQQGSTVIDPALSNDTTVYRPVAQQVPAQMTEHTMLPRSDGGPIMQYHPDQPSAPGFAGQLPSFQQHQQQLAQQTPQYSQYHAMPTQPMMYDGGQQSMAFAPNQNPSVLSSPPLQSHPTHYQPQGSSLSNRGRPAHELPVFSSTGTLPFANPSIPQAQFNQYVPGLPSTISSQHDPTTHGATVAQPNGFRQYAPTAADTAPMYDQWAVPDTPKR